MDIQHKSRRGISRGTIADSGMQMMHPLVVVCYYVGLGLLCMLHFHPVFLLTALMILLAEVRIIGAWKQLVEWKWAYVIMAVTIMIWNPLFSHRGERVLFYIKHTPIVLESVIYGFTMMLLVLCILVIFLNYNKLIGSLKFLYLFSRLSPRIAVMIAMSVRFAPLIRRRLSTIIAVQRTRGVSLRQGSLIERMNNGVKLLQIALVWSLEEAMHTADALAAKGYGTRSRSSYERYRFDQRDRITMVLIIILMIWSAVGWLYGYGVMAIYPSLDDQVMSSGLEWLQLCVFVSYLAIPIIIEGRETLRWRS
jgi:energy-coupling factor transport system permease protein